MVDAIGPIPLTLLVVPDFHHRGAAVSDKLFVRALDRRVASGDEIALHGYYHIDECSGPRTPGDWIRRRVLTQSEGEFAALPRSEAGRRLELGLEMMRRLNWPISGFVAPAWLLGKGARAALSQFDLLYTTTRSRIYRLPQWTATAAPALTYSARSAWRRAMSRAMVETQLRAYQRRPLLRIALHPVDARHDSVLEHWAALIANALYERVPLTKAAWVTAGAAAVCPAT
jgi:predicted deacetylase